VLISWQGGLNFYLGNHPGADGWSATAPGIRKDWWGGYEDGIRIPSRALGGKPSYREISAYWFRRGFDFMRDHPGEALRLLGRKAYLLFYGAELSNNQILSFSGRYSRVFRNLPLAFGVIAPLSLVGALLLGRDRRRSLLLLYLLTYGSTLVLFFVCSRFRIPLMPFFLIFGAAGLVGTARALRRAPGRGAALLAGILLLTALLNHDFGVVPPVNLAWGYEGEGVSLLRQGRFEEAADRFRKAIENDPRSPQAHHDLGVALREAGRPEDALPCFRKAIELDPRNAEAYNNLALTLSRLGREEEAIAVYREGLGVDPRHAGLHVNLAMLLHNLGRYGEAAEEYRAFIGLGHVDGRVHTNLGLCLQQLGREGEAEEELRRGAKLAPREPVPALRLAGFVAGRGDTAAARRILAAARDRMPENDALAAALEKLGKASHD
jgi:Flp pilus assembly protein TadD